MMLSVTSEAATLILWLQINGSPQGGGSRNVGIRENMTSGEGRPLSAGDSGYQRIRSDIIFGVLTPSGRLRLDAMKEDYGVSISTLREILNRLASEGFVVAEGQRGFEVAPVSIQNLRELADLRILLEHHAM